MLRPLLVLLGLLTAFFLVAVVFAWRYQERIVWQPPPAGPAQDGVWGPVVRRVTYAAEDGQPLFGYLVSADGASDDGVRPVARARGDADPMPPATAGRGDRPASRGRVLIAFHGNAETAAWTIGWARRVADETEWAVFLPEYRGYAGLPGLPTYEGSRHDARAAYAWVRDSLGVPPEHVGLFGYSLGSAVATELASEVRPAVLVLQSPFTSARDMARVAASWPVATVWRAIARVHFDTRRRVAALSTPVWVVHGDADRIIPVRMGRAVHAAARRKGALLEVPGAGHIDVADRGREAYWHFLRQALGAGETRTAAAPTTR